MGATLDLDAVQIRGGRAGPPVSNSDVDGLEKSLGVSMPAGYREYITRLGDGYLFTLLRVLPPHEILARLDEHQGQMAAYWFWDAGEAGFGQLEALDSIPVVDTLDGTIIVAWPGDADHLFVLDRSGDRVLEVPADVLILAEWLCTGGLGHVRARKRIFEPLLPDADGTRRTTLEDSSAQAEADAAVSSPPDLATAPADVLLAYIAELEVAEILAIEAYGGSQAFEGDPPEPDDPVVARAASRFGAVRRRYCSPPLARALGDSAMLSATPPHARATVRIVEEERLEGDRVRVRAAYGPEAYTETSDYTLALTGGEWRIIAERPWTDPALLMPVDEAASGPDPDRNAKLAAAMVDIERDPDDYWKLLGVLSEQSPTKDELEWVADQLRKSASDPGAAGRIERLRSLVRRG